MPTKAQLVNAQWKQIEETEFWRLYVAALENMEINCASRCLTAKAGDFYSRAARMFELQGMAEAVIAVKALPKKIIAELEEGKEKRTT